MTKDTNQNVEQVQKGSTNKKWRIMTGVFGGVAIAGLAASIGLGITLTKKTGGGEESLPHKINIEQPSVPGWSGNLIDAQGNPITDAKIGSEVIYYLNSTQNVNSKVKVPEYFTINDSEQKYYFSTTDDNIYYSAFNVPEAKDMNIKTYFTEVDEMVTVTFEAGEHGTITGQTSYRIKKESTFGSLDKPTVKADDGYSFVGWYINDVKVEDSKQILSDTTIVAKFQPVVMQNITFTYDDAMGYLYFNSKVIPKNTTVKIESGTVWGDIQHPSPIPKTGYEVSGVTVTDSSGTKTLTPDYIFTEDTTITYKFAEIESPTIEISTANCVGITASADTTLSLNRKGSFYTSPIIYYTTSTSPTVPSDQWIQLNGASPITINAGQTLYLRSYNFDGFNTKDAYYSFVLTNTLENEGSIEIKGDLMALLDGGLGTGLKNVPNNYCFAHLFEGSKAIKKVAFTNIPNVTTDGCFASMFANCSNLVSSNLAPRCTHDYEANCMYLKCAKLKEGFKFDFNTSLGRYACQQMFDGCSELPSSLFLWPSSYLPKDRVFDEGCCIRMFAGCKKFTTISQNAFDNGVYGAECFVSMFEDSGIQAIPNYFLKAASAQRNYNFEYGCCAGMFRKCTELTTISDNWLDLRVKDGYAVLGELCFADMFWGCTKLTKCNLVINEKVTLGKGCFSGIFCNCESLKDGTYTLEPTQLAPQCYASMFSGCTSFGANAPKLPAKVMATSCYSYMFNGCRALTVCPELPAIALAPNCYEGMFILTNITTLPKLNNIPLAVDCYHSMFYDCRYITSIPNNYLPATTLEIGCYSYMFNNCTNLTSIPTNLLPATTMVSSCYRSMFNGCIKITNAPSLSHVVVPTGVNYAFASMFEGCKQLKISEGSGRVAFFVGKKDEGKDNYRYMFRSTGGSYTNDPAEGKTYYYN